MDYVDICLSNDSQYGSMFLDEQNPFKTTLPNVSFLHYSGYGYSKRGVPFWLLKKVLDDYQKIQKFGIFFHELYAFGSPWKSEFWLSPAQRYIARRLAETSDFWITNREGSAQWLRRFAGKKPHAVLPVLSNVGEMSAYAPRRVPKIVVFGSAALRMATYRAAGSTLFSWASQQGLELHDIGPAINDSEIVSTLQNANVKLHGRLELQEVSKQLSDASFGLVTYPADYVAKSGVFAAYCAHGVCPILISKNYLAADGLLPNVHYLPGLPLVKINHSYEDIGYVAWEWYQPHRAMAHIDTLNGFLKQ